MNYKNILKIKIQLNEKPYNIINPLSEVNSNLLESIKKNFEKQKEELSSKEKTGFLLVFFLQTEIAENRLSHSLNKKFFISSCF